jgi:hypothetical protein
VLTLKEASSLAHLFHTGDDGFYSRVGFESGSGGPGVGSRVLGLGSWVLTKGRRTLGTELMMLLLLLMVMMMIMMVDLTVVCDAPTGSVLDLARCITHERYLRVAGYWWWWGLVGRAWT